MGLRTGIKPYNAENAWRTFQVANTGYMSQTMEERIKEEALKFYREGSKESLKACCGGAGPEEGIVFITDIAEQSNQVRIYGLVGSPLYIALHQHCYEEAEQILDSAPRAAEPGYAVQHFRVSFPAGEPEKGEVRFRIGGEIYLEEILLTDTELPDSLLIRLWNIFFQRETEDQPGVFEETCGEEQFPLLIREWPYCVQSRIRSGDLQSVNIHWCDQKHSREEYGPFQEAVQEGLKQFWKSLKGLYRLKTLAPDLYEAQVDEMFAAHLILKFSRIALHLGMVEIKILHDPTLSDRTETEAEPLHAVSKPEGAVSDAEEHTFIRGLHLAADGAEVLRKLKKGLQKLGFPYISGDTFWDACVKYSFHTVEQQSDRLGWAFGIWKEIFEGEFLITMDGLQKERSDRLMSILQYELLDPGGPNGVALVRSLDGLRWAENEGSEWLKQQRESAGRSFLEKSGRELLLLALEKNLFLPEDTEFLWGNCPEGNHMQLKPLLLMKKYGCL